MKKLNLNKVTDLKVMQVIAVRTTKKCKPYGFADAPGMLNSVEVIQYYDFDGNFLAEQEITFKEVNEILDF